MTTNSVSVGNGKKIVATFKYLGDDGNKSGLHSRIHQEQMNSGNAYRYSGRNILSFRVLSKTQYETVNLLTFYGCETWSLTMNEGCKHVV
jgi:hypothetical protein